MNELELQGEYVMDFFCWRADDLGFREVKNNAVLPDLFIPADLLEFLKENSRKQWQNLLRKSDYNSDKQIEKEYNKLIHRFLRHGDDTKVKKLIEENKEMYLEEFKENLKSNSLWNVYPYSNPGHL